MDRNEIKRRLIAGEPTPDVDDHLVWEVLAECRTETTGARHRVVDLMESVQSPDHHARFRTLIETRDTPRSDLKDADVPGSTASDYLPVGSDIAAAIRRAAEAYKQQGITINTPVARQKPITLAESRADLAKRITNPIERAYVLLSGRA